MLHGPILKMYIYLVIPTHTKKQKLKRKMTKIIINKNKKTKIKNLLSI
jgi:hypothetical protein